jgi:DNA polymerase III subunit epsilon
MTYNRFAFVDVETTGGSVNQDRIIEIGIIRVENNKVVDHFNSLVNPQTYLSPYIEYITGITPIHLEKAPLFEDIKDKVHELLQDCIFVAHNARFDYGFVRYELQRCGVTFSADCCCSVKLSRHLYPDYTHHNLDRLIERFNLNCKNRHRAYDDAHAVFQFYNYIQKQFPEEVVDGALKSIIQRPALPKNLDQTIINNLPESSGVYIFQDAARVPLYVGKSKHIKNRICSHFNMVYDSQKEMEMAQQVSNIEYVMTAGELGALLLESAMVKDLHPYYNKQLKAGTEMAIVRKKQNKDGYMMSSIETISNIQPEDFVTVGGVFKSKQKAKEFLQTQAATHYLCEKLLGLDNSPGPCFSSKIEKCYGACDKKEESLSYNARFTLAFEKKEIKPWPYSGAIAVSERDLFNGLEDIHIFKNWIYYGTIKVDRYETVYKKNNNIQFQYDMYMILKRLLPSMKTVRILSEEELHEHIEKFG